MLLTQGLLRGLRHLGTAAPTPPALLCAPCHEDLLSPGAAPAVVTPRSKSARESTEEPETGTMQS